MDKLLLTASVMAALILISVNYQGLSDFAERRVLSGPYLPIAGLEPVFEPLLIEPLADRPRIEYPTFTEMGYSHAEYNPEDGSVTLTYDDTYFGSHGMHLGYPVSRSGLVHTQTYQVGQTFAYACAEWDGYTKVGLFQYRGAGSFHGATTLRLVHFELRAPDTVPCEFPEYLKNTVDVYDAGWFDDAYDLEPYGGPPEGATDYETGYVLPVRHMVLTLPFAVDPIPLDPGPQVRISAVETATLNPDGSITMVHTKRGAGDAEPPAEITRTYMPGQSFVSSCSEEGDTTHLRVRQYRGTETLPGLDGPALMIGFFGGYTKAPIPCSYPDYVTDLVDVVDVGRLDRHYDMEYWQ